MKQISIMLWTLGMMGMLASPTGLAHDRFSAVQKLVSLEFVDDRGRVFTAYPTRSEEAAVFRAYLEARPEARYSIRARNLTGDRLGIVIAVDGRNIISGERSELAPNESMYVLDPYQSAAYGGWRTSAEEVRRFFFTNVDESYASRIGDESAMGVIAAAVYKGRRGVFRARQRQAGEGAPAPAASEAQDSAETRAERSTQAGTGFGESHYSRAVRVAFSPARRAAERSFFKYEWTEQLCARGIKSCEPANRFWPEPWQGFVPFPPGERG